jgi:hypothetical protein
MTKNYDTFVNLMRTNFFKEAKMKLNYTIIILSQDLHIIVTNKSHTKVRQS